ncbi:MAG: hypothetical protein BGO24_08250 [Sphingomonas sp. 67-36]|nr:MAG: hypothetical protein BGO24_08250 [Sphingomonas sp. 67-36]
MRGAALLPMGLALTLPSPAWAAESGTVPAAAPAGHGGVVFGRAVDLAGTPMVLKRPPAPVLPAAASGASGAGGAFAMPAGMPVAARALTSGFGLRQHPLLGERRAHLGLDLAAPTGAPIVATSPGIVSAGGWYGGYGSAVVLDHGGGVQTLYGHMSRRNVVVGQRVRRGDVIGFVGSTGLSTGPHLHYEVRVGSRPVDPISTLAK